MILDDLRPGSPATERGCGRLELKMEVVGSDEGKESKVFRRKRMDLRRVSSLSVDESDEDLLFGGNNLKKQRFEVEKERTRIEDAFSVRLPEIDAAGAGSSGVEPPPRLSHGLMSVIGRRREMEDAVAVELGFMEKSGKSYDFFGVYDGHGGQRVARACGEMLHNLLASVVEGETSNETDWPAAMAAGFRNMDDEVNKIGASVATMGSTAVVAVVGDDELVVANCGDSRAVLCRAGVAVQLSDDHKPDRPDELARIELAGGRVINWNGQRVLGVLATSRSIGDDYLKPYVIADPETRVMNRGEDDEFLILASDGLWDVVSNDLACQVVRRCFQRQIRSRRRQKDDKQKCVEEECDEKIGERGGGEAETAAAMLSELAMAKGSRDNISVVVVGLKF
ncbi:protein phosphatase 2C 51-like [Andrographis paniculata]|uniref:protein phosphatase 2C 51-like n=1 Tax=Andrographis paniculata TaxID=175694 RepID=UPI0021E8761C|nr:protein phosphatase 2C 51-like [Andrographis paniculata]